MKHAWMVIVGLVLIAIGQLVVQIMPLLGRVAYQAAAAGSYSPSEYEVNLIAYNTISALIIVLGIVAVAIERRRA